MPRQILPESHIHPAVREQVSRHHERIVQEVQAAMANHAVVVVGMGHNPFPRKARRLLDGAGVAHHYMPFGSYLAKWRPRTALKMWSGWPTLPMVFVKGVLVGGADDLKRLLDSGELKKMLA